MTSQQQHISPGDEFAARSPDIVVSVQPPERIDDAPPSPADLSNVIPFARKASAEPATPVAPVTAADRPAPPPAAVGRYRLIAIVLISILVHAGLFYLFLQQRRQLSNIGIDAIEIEIVVGDNRAAGTATTAGETEAQPSLAVEEVKKEEDEKPVEREQPKAEAREVPPEDKVAEAIVEPEPPKEQPAPTPPSAPSDSASGSGRRAAAGDANYYGLVARHLARNKQYPSAARNNRIQGRGTVTFTINGNGSVTSVEIVHSSGAAILDQEILAMVRRAAPFPKPQNGESVSFTAPVDFKLN